MYIIKLYVWSSLVLLPVYACFLLKIVASMPVLSCHLDYTVSRLPSVEV